MSCLDGVRVLGRLTAIGHTGPRAGLSVEHAMALLEAEPTAAGAGATITGDDSTVLLFALGRASHTDARLSISGDQASGRRFKLWLPGP